MGANRQMVSVGAGSKPRDLGLQESLPRTDLKATTQRLRDVLAVRLQFVRVQSAAAIVVERLEERQFLGMNSQFQMQRPVVGDEHKLADRQLVPST